MKSNQKLIADKFVCLISVHFPLLFPKIFTRTTQNRYRSSLNQNKEKGPTNRIKTTRIGRGAYRGGLETTPKCTAQHNLLIALVDRFVQKCHGRKYVFLSGDILGPFWQVIETF